MAAEDEVKLEMLKDEDADGRSQFSSFVFIPAFK